VVGHDVWHLWHGEMADRGARRRHLGLARFGFDPATDLAADASGPWRWNSEKPAMHAYVRDYLLGRREDG
jgi:hypothetical protein